MIEGYSVRKCGELLEISKDTAFSWRHKVLHALAECPIPQLRGLVEADETYELYSEKGRRELTRKARKRGGTASQRGINNEQTCILVARDRDKQTIVITSSTRGYFAKVSSSSLNDCSEMPNGFIFPLPVLRGLVSTRRNN
jgi:hypothetical protein